MGIGTDLNGNWSRFEWELEQICAVSLLTNQVIKVVHSCLKSPPE